MWNQNDIRKDLQTAAWIDHSLAVQAIAGPTAAYCYLVQCGIPVMIVTRVLASSVWRRQLGVISIAPVAGQRR